ncbi:hypothetical protein KFL_001420170 [Klebsormidium nitens]|uniref:Uncharacterized protein n=1 Tax=Klebsormidium nitens TaxID=105231 RepID=A0A1Y1I288_KLENI|nr:hypothetical protein KFL_001420170 [Klebsormidium nitens]|eukprot:GAQ83291.1 hypothetical protein KFL_001420170 [Klebsormidium nitens]
MTYVSLPWFALNGNNWASPLVRFFTLVGALGLTLVLTMETALAVYVTRKDFQGDGSPSTARIQASETLAGSNIGGPWQIWGTSVINSVILYGLGTGTFLAVARVFFTLFPWFSPQPPHTRLEVALFFLFCISLITLTTSLGSTLILALPAAFIEGSTSIASNLRSVRLGKGQRLQMFGLFAFSLMFNPLVDYIFLGFTPHLWGSSWVVVATVLGFLAMGPAVAYFQVVWVVAYLSARKREDPTFAWPSAEEALLV